MKKISDCSIGSGKCLDIGMFVTPAAPICLTYRSKFHFDVDEFLGYPLLLHFFVWLPVILNSEV